MKNKKQIVIATSVLVLVTILLLGLTYAYYKTRINGNSKDKSISVTSKKLEITYADGNGVIEGTGIEPGYTTTKTFIVENTGDETLSYSIKLDNITNTFTRTEDWTYVLKKGETEVNSGVLPTVDSYILDTISIDSKTTDSYSLTITYANLTDVDQSIDMGATLSLRVNIDDFSNPYANNKDSLAYNIINNAINVTNGTELLASPKTKVAEEISEYETGKFEYETVSTGSLCSGSDAWFIGDTAAEALAKVNKAASFQTAVGKYVYDDCSHWTKYLESYDSSTSTLKFKIIERKNETTLSVTADDYGISYYYRGNVTDNYVNFAGMCWKIVRIAGDGSVKLILEDQDSTCASSDGNWDIPTTTGGTTKTGNFGFTTYEANSLTASDGTKNSGVIAAMNYLNGQTDSENSMAYAFKNFQTGPLASYLDKLKSGDWCLDDKAYTTETDNSTPLTSQEILDKQIKGTRFYYDSEVRLNGKETKEPTLKCNGTNMTKFNDNIDMYVGTLTADEIVYAGSTTYYYTNGNYYYLMNNYQLNNNLTYMTLTPSRFASPGFDTIYIVRYYGKTEGLYLDDWYSFRPAINLKSDVEITSGNGTKTNPYIVS